MTDLWIATTETISADIQPCDLYRHGGAQLPLVTHRLEVNENESLWLCGTCLDNTRVAVDVLRGENNWTGDLPFRPRRLAERIVANSNAVPPPE